MSVDNMKCVGPCAPAPGSFLGFISSCVFSLPTQQAAAAGIFFLHFCSLAQLSLSFLRDLRVGAQCASCSGPTQTSPVLWGTFLLSLRERVLGAPLPFP